MSRENVFNAVGIVMVAGFLFSGTVTADALPVERPTYSAPISSLESAAKSKASIRNKIAIAKLEIQFLEAENLSIDSELSTKNYFLSVAEAYNDSTRAQTLRSEIAYLELDKQLNQLKIKSWKHKIKKWKRQLRA